MKLEVTDLSPVRKTLAIEAEEEDVRREEAAVVKTYASKAHIPGFRPGKAPLAVIRSRFGQDIRSDVRDRLMARLYDDAIREKELRPVGDPAVEGVEFEDGSSLRFKATVDVYPDFTAGDYREIEAARPTERVPDAEVESMLEELRQAHARLVSEEGRAATTGDVLVADLEGTPEVGEPFKREKILIEVGSSDNIPSFNDSVDGAKAGDDLTFQVPYPDGFPNPDLAGKTVAYRVHVHEVKRREVPDLDDEFAKDMGDFDDLAALRARIRADLQERKKGEADAAVRRAVLDQVLLANPIPLPDTLVEREIRSRMEDLVRGFVRQGLNPEKMELDWKEIRDKQDEPARKTVHARLILDRIAEQEAISVSPGEVQDLVRREAQRINQPYDKLRSDLVQAGGLQAIEVQLLREKSLDFVVSVANIRTEE